MLGEENEQLGVMPTYQALELAQERGLDLVEVAPTAEPPVCRIVDYGRFKYESEKKAREVKKRQHTSELKEIRLRPRTDEHDLAVRAKHARRFLEEGHKVRLEVRFRGREVTHPEVAREQIERIVQGLTDIAVLERPPQMEGRSMAAILARGKTGVAAAPAAEAHSAA